MRHTVQDTPGTVPREQGRRGDRQLRYTSRQSGVAGCQRPNNRPTTNAYRRVGGRGLYEDGALEETNHRFLSLQLRNVRTPASDGRLVQTNPVRKTMSIRRPVPGDQRYGEMRNNRSSFSEWTAFADDCPSAPPPWDLACVQHAPRLGSLPSYRCRYTTGME